ncbi:hypothetical protein MMPV_000075 [Pyropia vietnamensis]
MATPSSPLGVLPSPPPPPLRDVQPYGNALLPGAAPSHRAADLGALAVLPDGLLLRVLGALQSGADIDAAGAASRTLHAASRDAGLWRSAVLRQLHPTQGVLGYAGSWRATYIRGATAEARGVRWGGEGGGRQGEGADDGRASTIDWRQGEGSRPPLRSPPPSPGVGGRWRPSWGRGAVAVDCGSVYSDVLFHSRRLAAAPIDPAWLAGESVPRVAAVDMSAEAFRSRYEAANTPVVVTGGMALGVGGVDWADVPDLLSRWGGSRFHAGGYELCLSDYVAYAAATTDDQALVLFDRAEGMGGGMGGGYRVPAVFEEDLFEVLDEGIEDEDDRGRGRGGSGGGSSGRDGGDGPAGVPRPRRRPDYRWLIAGPSRSGSTFHTDPNGTSAWNGVLAGTKRWVLFPPEHPPPGVHTTTTTTTTSTPAGCPTPLTATSVVSPLTPLEWWSTYHAAAVASPHCVQATVSAGDVMFIPSGWWHAVLNTEPWTVAVTQNFVSAANLRRVRHFLRNRRGDVSGVEGKEGVHLAEAFDDALRRRRPDVWAAAVADDKKDAAAAAAAVARSRSALPPPAATEESSPPSANGGAARKRPRSLWEALGGTTRRGVGKGRPAAGDRDAAAGGVGAVTDDATPPSRMPFTFGF